MRADREAVFEFLGEASRIGRLATTDGTQPHVVPVWWGLHGGRLLVHTLPRSRKARNVATTGRFALAVDTDTWPYRGVVLRGRARLADPEEFDLDRFLLDTSIQYLGEDAGRAMSEQMGRLPEHALLVLEPEAWNVIDFAADDAP